jgi:hypothetical protein
MGSSRKARSRSEGHGFSRADKLFPTQTASAAEVRFRRAKLSAMMTDIAQMTDEQFEAHTLALLHRELGLEGLARFLHLYRAGDGDYTRDRHQWLEGLTIEQIADELKQSAV